MADEPAEVNGETGGGDEVGWNCSLCTYKNSPDKFKCEVCDCRRGTSTRKPRGSTDTIVAQVMKQQEQIRQQTRAKPSPKNKTGTSTPTLGSSQLLNDSTKLTKKSHQPRASNSSVSHEGTAKRAKLNDREQSREPANVSNSDESDDSQESASEELKARTKSKDSRKKREQASSSDRKSKSNKKSTSAKTKIRDDSSASSSESEDDETESDCTSVVSDSVPGGKSRRVVDEASSESSADDRSVYSSASSPSMTPEPTTSSPNHPLIDENRPIEINGNLIKYNPPTSTGRTGLIIDKKKFTQHSITVDDVTITFTEFATRQNRYIRKKKKRSRTKSAPAPTVEAVDAE